MPDVLLVPWHDAPGPAGLDPPAPFYTRIVLVYLRY